jgi:hypothetical protein
MLKKLLTSEDLSIEQTVILAGKAMGFELFSPGPNERGEVTIYNPSIKGFKYIWNPINDKQHIQEIIDRFQFRVDARTDTIEVFFNDSHASMLDIKSICGDTIVGLVVTQAAARIGSLIADSCLLCEQNIPHGNCASC